MAATKAAKPGRPTAYTPEMVDKTREYLESYETPIPSIAGLALYLNLNRSTVNRWATEEGKEEFKDILDDILATQEQTLMCMGLTGDFNSAIVKLALGKHGYHDKQDNTLSAPGGGPVQTDSVFEFIPVGADG